MTLPAAKLQELLKPHGDLLPLRPQLVGRFYGDLNRLGQRAKAAPRPAYWQPERWIVSSTQAANPPEIPTGGRSVLAGLPQLELAHLLADGEFGPRLLGAERFSKHAGQFRVLIKLLDAACPIPVHVHANDAFVQSHRTTYPNEQFGKDEAYHFLEAPKGPNPYTHLGVYPGVDSQTLIDAMARSSDHVVELCPGALQRFGEGFHVKAGLLHRPGTALTLEIQQPSDVYTLFQYDFGGDPIPPAALHPGFPDLHSAAQAVVNWAENLDPQLLENSRLRPTPAPGDNQPGGRIEWVFPPSASHKFSGQRVTVQQNVTLTADQPAALYVWSGQGTINGLAVDGARGGCGKCDELFAGVAALQPGLHIANTGNEPLVLFALYAAQL